eukprot:348678_1
MDYNYSRGRSTATSVHKEYSRGRSTASIHKETSPEKPGSYTRSRRNGRSTRSIIFEEVEQSNSHSSISNTEEEEVNFNPVTTEAYGRVRREDTVLSSDDPLNQSTTKGSTDVILPHDDDDEDDERETEDTNDDTATTATTAETRDVDSLTRERSKKVRYNTSVEQTLLRENQSIVFEGYLERKTNQKVLGKHLWETRYFKLSTHSLSIYVTNKTNITESVIKLSSIASINRNTKSDGSDLKDNRFDIDTKQGVINLRSENNMKCKQWIHCLTQQRKKHRQSIRNGLGTLEDEAQAPSTVKRYKRNRTKRENNEEMSVNIKIKEEEEEEEFDEPQIDDEEKQQLKGNGQRSSVQETMAFEGFLVRRIGHLSSKMGEKIYFKLSDDALEFSKIEDAMDDTRQALSRKHQSNIMGSISIEHIKNVRMMNEDNDEEFLIVFNENNSNNDWILSTQKQDLGNAKKWVNVLSRAKKEAETVAEKINKLRTVSNVAGEEIDEEEDSEEDSSDSEETFGTNAKRKKRKKLGGTIKALQNMINDETIDELEAARNQEMDQQKLVNGFEINTLEDRNQNNEPQSAG